HQIIIIFFFSAQLCLFFITILVYLMNINGPKIANTYCDGMLQSPINIVTANVVANDNLTLFSFTDTLPYNGLLAQLNPEKMAVEGGALTGLYKSTQHTVDGKLYSLHTVNYKAGQNSSVGALADPTGPAVLLTLLYWSDRANWGGGVLLNFAGDMVALVHSISMDSLLQGVNMVQNYQYLGSLTVPNCSEDVVWIVFKDPIKVSLDLLSVGNSVALVYAQLSLNSTTVSHWD
uniref:Alpha-carbonic anhydrase domain-containing protein n=1 Tax=Electrophorus electricus TaxID=8005 RepID=A0A4W4H2D5_ELEEL